ncbi:hypothetical protein GY45DRAFT_1327236 [Cubamyces sp. BRFM 1775]|nr:hypothetical protein GY45DRAFT_1327236 [Cubamyces sp. BRFM 1775]
MTSLREYAARRRKASYYSPGADPTLPTGTPVEPSGPIADHPPNPPPNQNIIPAEAPSVEKHINEPMGIVEEIAHEYFRLQNELGPRPRVVLDEETIRQQRIKEQEEQERHERAVFTVQYHKLLNQTAYVKRVWKRMEESGYFDEEGDVEEFRPDEAEGVPDDGDDDESTDQSPHGDPEDRPPEEAVREEGPALRRSPRKRRSVRYNGM